jgi:hypothetical protein
LPPRLLTAALALAASLTASLGFAQRPAYVPIINDAAVGDPYAIGTSGSWLQAGSTAGAGNQALLTTASYLIPGSSMILGSHEPDQSRLWLSGEYLLWGTDGMQVPVLVTTSPANTPQNQAAILGEPGVGVLFGGGEVNGDAVSGFRVGGGFWITHERNYAIEAEYFRLGQQDDQYRGGSDGSTILGRPFFDIVAGQETAQLISYPGLVSGNIGVDTESNLQSFLINGRAGLCPTHGSGCNCRQSDRVDWIVGYRFLELKDSVNINENLTSQITSAPGTISLSDQFSTTNRFNGLQLGIVHRSTYKRAWLESMVRVAIGGNKQTVNISGNTSLTEAGFTDTFNSGLLAQRTNSGGWERDEFVMVPELGAKLGFRLTKRLHATVGYTALYFPNVVRAGEQIDTDVNPNLVAPEVDPLTGALRPRFRFVQTDYWAHGLTLGGELRF